MKRNILLISTMLCILLRGYLSGGAPSQPPDIKLYVRKKAINWTIASNACKAVGKTLCRRKDVCRQNGESVAPQENVRRHIADRWVPIADEYNDWVYLGHNNTQLCSKISDTAGPPSWNIRQCSTLDPETTSTNKLQFCAAAKSYYCCVEMVKVESPSPHELPIFLQSVVIGGEPYYSFALTANSYNDQVEWRNRGRLPGDIAKFELMSGFVKNKFEKPVYFCTRTSTTDSGLSVTLHMVSKGWCTLPWKLNFYAYASFSPINPEEYQKLEVGYAGTAQRATSRISVEENPKFATKFEIYAPLNNMHENIVLASLEDEDACASGTEELTSLRGIISSPRHPRNFQSKSEAGVSCHWRVIADSSSVIRITFKAMNLSTPETKKFFTFQENSFLPQRASSYDFERNCTLDKVDIVGYGSFCGNELPPSFVTTTSQVDLHFHGKSNKNGFSLLYEVISPPNGLSFSRNANSSEDYTWTAAKDACEEEEQRLCTAKEICRFDKRPFYGIEDGDHWAPIADEYNDWVQVGRGNVRTCTRHNRAYGPHEWGIVKGLCNVANITAPCPRREVLYCCDNAISLSSESKSVTIKILTTVQNGIVFSRYIRRGIDSEPRSGFWSAGRKTKKDVTTFCLFTNYQPGVSRVVYFCRRTLVPAIGKLMKVYSMFMQPCESKGWKLMYYLYAPDISKTNPSKIYVGMYKKWPYHSRVSSGSFADDFQGDNGFILYNIKLTAADEETIVDSEDRTCKGVVSVVTAPAILQSPGYPMSYNNDVDCRWHIKLPDNSNEKDVRLKITIEELSLEDPVDILSVYELPSGVNLSETALSEIQEGIGDNTRRRDYTGTVRHVSLVTKGSFLLVFKTDMSVSEKGFRVETELLNNACGGKVNKHASIITSPNYPHHYSGDLNCTWMIRAPSERYFIELQFGNFDLDASNCLEIEYKTPKLQSIKMCGPSITPTLRINSSSATVSFETKVVIPKPGKGFTFQVYFESTLETEGNETVPERQCGIQTVPFTPAEIARDKIVGGNVARRGNFPWMVMITRGNGTLSCGGALLNERFVLTAAHCFLARALPEFGVYVLTRPIEEFVVIAGGYKVGKPAIGEQHSKISDLTWHTSHRNQWFVSHPGTDEEQTGMYSRYDFVMLYLETKMVYSPTVSPICITKHDVNVGEYCYVMGWGSTDVAGKVKGSALKYARVPILDSSLCNSWPEMTDLVEAESLCAGHPGGGDDFCYGDSGGPLVCRGPFGNFYINGIINWNRQCGGRRMPGVYTSVPFIYDWIVEIIEDKGHSS